MGFSWVLVVISQIGKMLPKPMLGSSKPANWDFSVPTGMGFSRPIFIPLMGFYEPTKTPKCDSIVSVKPQ